jgi:hypothetical protein
MGIDLTDLTEDEYEALADADMDRRADEAYESIVWVRQKAQELDEETRALVETAIKLIEEANNEH